MNIKKLHLQGYNKSEIARAVGLSRKRVRRILASEEIKLSEKELYLRRFIRRHNSKIKEGKLLSEYIGKRKYFFKPEQIEEIKRLAEEYRKAGKRCRYAFLCFHRNLAERAF